jgi:proteic killer suppression protein
LTTQRQTKICEYHPATIFEKIRGNLEGFHSIRVNKQWRLIFQWDGTRGEAKGVYLDDHSYL